MPSIHIPEPVFEAFVKEYGYTRAKHKVKEVCREHIEEGQADE